VISLKKIDSFCYFYSYGFYRICCKGILPPTSETIRSSNVWSTCGSAGHRWAESVRWPNSSSFTLSFSFVAFTRNSNAGSASYYWTHSWLPTIATIGLLLSRRFRWDHSIRLYFHVCLRCGLCFRLSQRTADAGKGIPILTYIWKRLVRWFTETVFFCRPYWKPCYLHTWCTFKRIKRKERLNGMW